MQLVDLTWSDLEEWAGPKIVARGKSGRGAVEELRITADGRLVAWVQGGSRYATMVGMSEAGQLWSACTCPYAVSCKHAVATLLAYLDRVEAGETVPAAPADDSRLQRLAQKLGSSDEDGQDTPTRLAAASKPDLGTGPGTRADPDDALRRYLEELPPAALRELAEELAADFPEVRQRVLDRAQLRVGDAAQLIRSTRLQIEEVSAEAGWSRPWSDEGHLPDYAPIRDRLEQLLAAGHADDVVALGEQILQRTSQQVEMSDDDGQTAQAIASCLEVVLRALSASSLTGVKRLLWDIDARLGDDFSLLDGLRGPLDDDASYTPADWSAVADELARRMGEMPSNESGAYHRQGVMRWQLVALRQANRAGETTAILQREAAVTRCYVELVDQLLAGEQLDAAVQWARQGFEQTIEQWPGIAWPLLERLCDLAGRQGDLPMVAAYRAMEFWNRPDVARYRQVQQATLPLGLWDTVRPLLLHWLETGWRPDVAPAAAAAAPERSRCPSTPWPLPCTGLPLPEAAARHRSFPETTALIDLAIEEDRYEDALRWYWHDVKRRG